MKIILLLFFVPMFFLTSQGQNYTISGLIKIFNSEDQCHELLTEDGYEYNKEKKWWQFNGTVVYFNRFPDGEKQLKYEFFNKNFYKSLIEQLETMKYDKLSQKIEGCEVYYNNKYFISLNPYMVDYDGLEVKRFSCSIERTDKVAELLNRSQRLKSVNYKGVSFKIPSEWLVDTLTTSNSINIFCKCESDFCLFKVELTPVTSIDSAKLRMNADYIVNDKNDKGASISNTYIGHFNNYDSYIFDFTLNPNETKVNGRCYIFQANKKYLLEITFLTLNENYFKDILQYIIEKSFMIASN